MSAKTASIAIFTGLACVVSLRVLLATASHKKPSAATSNKKFQSFLPDLAMDETEYTALLEQLIGEAEHVQNFPPEFVPKESRVVRHLVKKLEHLDKKRGGALEVEVVSFVEGRENLIVRYRSENPKAKTISLVGSHLDVVPADPKTWQRPPFKLSVEGDQLFGRGTTDCLGHVALLTLVMKQLGISKPKLGHHVVCVFIASEENDSIKGVGIDGLMKAGFLDELKNGSMLWIDASDSQPCMGTAGALQWKLTATGKRFHSGFPQNTVNSIELVNNALTALQSKFYEMFPPHPEEARYKFATPTTLKPTQLSSAAGSLNQIPPTASISGDIRLTPFHDVDVVVQSVNSIIADMNKDISALENIKELGPSSRFHGVAGVTPTVELEWLTKGDLHSMEGIACHIDSPGFHALVAAIEKVRGSSVPYSINGSLPLVRQMQRMGFDVQITGFGLSKTYHADNEYALLSDMVKGGEIVWLWIQQLERSL